MNIEQYQVQNPTMASLNSSDCKDEEKMKNLEEIEKVLLGLSPPMPQNLTPQVNSEENMEVDQGDDSDDDLIILESNIYKYGGESSSIEDQVSEGILKFEYRDEDDEDIIEIDVIEKKKNISLVCLDDEKKDPDSVETNKDVDVLKDKVKTSKDPSENKLEEHKLEKQPVRNRRIKQFENGNFFMLAD